MLKKHLTYTVLLFLFAITDTIGQSINTSFGKNRIQYHNDFNNWKQYETANFLVYWYGKGEEIAHTVIQMAELDHEGIQKLLEHRINDKIEIVVYLDMTDLKQSNIGYEEAFSNQTGKTKIVENKMFVQFNGEHENLRRQIREGIASVYLNSILSGSNLQEIVQNAILLDLPEWFREGLISYVGVNWDYELDDELRDILYQDEKYFEFSKLEKDYPKIAGHSLWHFIDNNYGRSAIANILYLTRINRNLKSSFLYVLNQEFEQVLLQWENWIDAYFTNEEDKYNKLENIESYPYKKRAHIPISLLKLSPDGNSLLLAENQLGKYMLYLLDIKSGERKRLFKFGSKNNFQATDYNYPVAAWHPTKNEISFIYEHRDILYLRKLNTDTEEYIEQSLPENFQRVYSMSYWDEERYIFSGSLDGLSDLLVYDTKGRSVKKITDDYFDDVESVVVQDDHFHGVLFRSNRTNLDLERQVLDTILPLDQFDIFYLELDEEFNGTLNRLTNTEHIKEQQIQYLQNGNYTYLSSRNGFLNLFYASSTASGQALSNYDRNIILHSSSGKTHAFTAYHDGDYKLYILPHPDETLIQTFTEYYTNNSKGNTEVLFPVLKKKTDVDEFPKEWEFQSNFTDPPDLEPLIKRNLSGSNRKSGQPGEKAFMHGLEKIIPERSSPARLSFKIDDITTKLDNSVFFEGLESYVDGENGLDFSSMGILFKARAKDLFEDYIFEGGIKIPTRFNGTEYFVSFDNNKKLIDQRFSFYRKTRTESVVEGLINSEKIKSKTLLAQYRLKYPFDVNTSLRATIGLRNDKQFFLSADALTLNAPLLDEKRISLKLEYVYDNTIDLDVNIKNGTRYKFYAEAINEFDLKLIDGASFDASKSFTTVIGFDARHYEPIGKHAVFALRSAGATSLGPNKMLYYLGGTESDLLKSFNDLTPVPQKEFAFQVPVANLRGFDTNVRNGSSYVLGNIELRLPVVKMLGFEKMRLAFLRNLQLAGFFDVGLAWHGLSPYSDDNPLNVVNLENPPIIKVNVQYFRDPIVMSYGFGARTTLFGYLVRLDYAWGIETRAVQSPQFHLSLGTDF